MLKKSGLVITIISVISIAFVGYMYSQNYIVFESGIHIVIPSKSTPEKHVEREFQPANVQPDIVDTNLISRVEMVAPSNQNTKIEEPRLFDDIMRAVETFSPLMLPYLTLHLFKKKGKKKKKDEDGDIE